MMRSGCFSFGKCFEGALIALLMTLIAFGRPLDDAAHAAALEIEAGNTSPLLYFLAAFDVIDDPADHQPGEAASEKAQLVMQLAAPQSDMVSFAGATGKANSHPAYFLEAVTTRPPIPLERPPRI